MQLNCFLITEYAGATADGRSVIAGTFDNMDIGTTTGLPIPAETPIPVPACYLAIVLQGSLADGLAHVAHVRILNGDGKPIGASPDIPFRFQLNKFGRPLRAHLFLRLNNLMLPGPDDYEFILTCDDDPTVLGRCGFTITDTGNRPNG